MRSSLLRQAYWYVCSVPHRRLSRRCPGTSAGGSKEERLSPGHPLVECSQSAEGDLCHVALVEQFITQEEEDSLMGEVEKSLRRSRYQYEHWDGVGPGQHPSLLIPTTAADITACTYTWCFHLPFLFINSTLLLIEFLTFIQTIFYAFLLHFAHWYSQALLMHNSHSCAPTRPTHTYIVLPCMYLYAVKVSFLCG